MGKMPETREVTVYRFSELTAKVQQKLANDYHESIWDYEEAVFQVAQYLEDVSGIKGEVQVEEGSQHFTVYVDGKRLEKYHNGYELNSKMFHFWQEMIYPGEQEVIAQATEHYEDEDAWFLRNGILFETVI
jgi:hypothetical protein